MKVEDKYGLTNSLLGVGGYATVRLCTSLSPGNQSFALKTIDKERYLKWSLELKHLLDGNALMKLDHPNILHLFDFFETESSLSLVQEIALGGDLFDLIIQSSGLGEERSRLYFTQSISAVAYLHSQGIVHRNLKPENMLLLESTHQTLKLCGFTFSCSVEDLKHYDLSYDIRSYEYIAPELLFGSEYKGVASDMWNLGVVLFVMVSGYPPFSADYNEFFEQTRLAYSSFDERHWANCSQAVKALITGLLTPDPAKRLTATEALQHPWITNQ